MLRRSPSAPESGRKQQRDVDVNGNGQVHIKPIERRDRDSRANLSKGSAFLIRPPNFSPPPILSCGRGAINRGGCSPECDGRGRRGSFDFDLGRRSYNSSRSWTGRDNGGSKSNDEDKNMCESNDPQGERDSMNGKEREKNEDPRRIDEERARTNLEGGHDGDGSIWNKRDKKDCGSHHSRQSRSSGDGGRRGARKDQVPWEKGEERPSLQATKNSRDTLTGRPDREMENNHPSKDKACSNHYASEEEDKVTCASPRYIGYTGVFHRSIDRADKRGGSVDARGSETTATPSPRDPDGQSVSDMMGGDVVDSETTWLEGSVYAVDKPNRRGSRICKVGL